MMDNRVPILRHLRIAAGSVCALVLLFAVAVPMSSKPLAADTLEAAMRALKSNGRVVLMRHTQTVPGVGDPDGFKLGDCSTQRNLNKLGIDQAKRLGLALKAAGISIGGVLVSEWCRADDTARHVLEAAGMSDVPRQRFWPLNNVWDNDSRLDQQVAEVRVAIAKWRGPGVLLMVSHGVTIRPVLGRTTSQGGFFVIKPTGDMFEIVAEYRL